MKREMRGGWWRRGRTKSEVREDVTMKSGQSLLLRGGTLETMEQFVVGKVLQSGRKVELTLARVKKEAQAVVASVQSAWQTGTPPRRYK